RRVAIRDLGDGGRGGVNAVTVAAVHRIGTWGERLALAAAVGRIAGRFPVNDIRGDRQDRLGVKRIPIGRVLTQLVHERADQPDSELVDAVIVVAELRERALGSVV